MAKNRGVKAERVEAAVRKIFETRARVPGLEDLAHEILHQFGGARSFASEFMALYKSTSSQQTKAKLLDCVMKLLVKSGANQAPAGIEQMSDAELEAVAAEVIKNAAQEEAETPAGAGGPGVAPGARALGGDAAGGVTGPGPGPRDCQGPGDDLGPAEHVPGTNIFECR